MGGDGAFYYTGMYEINGKEYQTSLRIRRHSKISDSVFGDIDDSELDANGELNDGGKELLIHAHVLGTNRELIGVCRWLDRSPQPPS